MASKILIISLFFFLSVSVNAQSELIGTYKGSLSINKEAIVELQIQNSDSLIISGSGVYPENQKFEFQGVIQEMNIDLGFSTIYRAVLQIQMYDDHVDGYEPISDFIELNIEVEFVIDDSDGIPDVTEEVSAITINGIWHETQGMDPENIEFSLSRTK